MESSQWLLSALSDRRQRWDNGYICRNRQEDARAYDALHFTCTVDSGCADKVLCNLDLFCAPSAPPDLVSIYLLRRVPPPVMRSGSSIS